MNAVGAYFWAFITSISAGFCVSYGFTGFKTGCLVLSACMFLICLRDTGTYD